MTEKSRRLFAELARQVNQLPHMMIGVSSAAQKNREALRSFGFTHRAIWVLPILRGLFFDGLDHHRDRPIKRRQHLAFRLQLRFVEFTITIPHVALLSHPCPDVVTQVASHVQQQVTNTISMCEWPLP